MPLANLPLPKLPLLGACYMPSLPLPEPKEMSNRNQFRTRTGPAFALLLLATGLLSPAARASDQGSLDTQELQAVTVVTQDRNQTFATEFANTPDQRARGLMFRTRLPERQGMLFDFGRDQEIRMWMKNTLIPLDMIFIQSDGRIHRIERNTKPGSLRPISSNGSVRAVLELRAGSSKKYRIAPGDRVIHHPFSR
jgi:uncharacterized membrane protein (UPF0127 family)